MADVLVDGVSVGAVTSYTFTNVSANHTIAASFAINTNTLTYNAGSNGTISGTTPQTVDYNGSGSAVTAVPNAGYHFVSWSDGVLTAARTDSSVQANLTVTASFAISEYSLTINITGSGTVDKSPDQPTYHYGDVVTLTPHAAANWIFGTFSPVSPLTITGDTTVNAVFIGPPVKLGFKTLAQNIVAGSASDVITVETQDINGTAANVHADTAINLYSTSGLGRFDTSTSGLFNGSLVTVTVLANHSSVDFYYKDSAAVHRSLRRPALA